ncbi:MAG: DUF948 domain-containing protein [Gammaproteobacteria bacterium]|nr:DUF948 domain-containing protein [Gammaproteobacteria bacterium]
MPEAVNSSAAVDSAVAQSVAETPLRRHNIFDESGRHMERIASVFESSAKRWELMVYPSLLAFVILASYGFFLVYSLSHDMATMARNISEMTKSIELMVDDMGDMSGNVNKMSANLSSMTQNINRMTTHIEGMHTEMQHLEYIRQSMTTMGQDTHLMVNSVEGMRREMASMNYNIGRPMHNMSSLFPFIN